MIQLSSARVRVLSARRRSPRRRSLHVSHVDAVQQHRQRRRVHLYVRGTRGDLRHAESPLRQSLIVEDEAIAVPDEDLHAIKTTSQEDKEMSAERVEAPRTANDCDQAVVAATKVHGLGGQVHADARRQRQHRRRRRPISSPTYATSVPASTCTRTSPTSTTISRAALGSTPSDSTATRRT